MVQSTMNPVNQCVGEYEKASRTQNDVADEMRPAEITWQVQLTVTSHFQKEKRYRGKTHKRY